MMISAKKDKTMDMIKSKDGVLLTKTIKFKSNGKEHFVEVSNCLAPEERSMTRMESLNLKLIFMY